MPDSIHNEGLSKLDQQLFKQIPKEQDIDKEIDRLFDRYQNVTGKNLVKKVNAQETLRAYIANPGSRTPQKKEELRDVLILHLAAVCGIKAIERRNEDLLTHLFHEYGLSEAQVDEALARQAIREHAKVEESFSKPQTEEQTEMSREQLREEHAVFNRRRGVKELNEKEMADWKTYTESGAVKSESEVKISQGKKGEKIQSDPFLNFSETVSNHLHFWKKFTQEMAVEMLSHCPPGTYMKVGKTVLLAEKNGKVLRSEGNPEKFLRKYQGVASYLGGRIKPFDIVDLERIINTRGIFSRFNPQYQQGLVAIRDKAS